MRRAFAVAAFVFMAASLLLQASITIPQSMAVGRGLPASVVYLLGFFTILTNILVALVYASEAFGPHGRVLRFFAAAGVRAGVAASIALVGIVYATVLASIWQPQGLFLVCDIALHYISPTVFVVWWLATSADGSTRWRNVPVWALWPLGYLPWAFVAESITDFPPYPFLDVEKNGMGGVALAAAAVTVLFLLIGCLTVLADHAAGRVRGARK